MSCRSTGRRRRAVVALAVLLALGVSTTACGAGAEEATEDAAAAQDEDVDQDAQACRDRWRALSEEVDTEAAGETGDTTPTPSSLRARYVTIAAQIDYYATSAVASDCETTLQAEEATIAALGEFREQLAAYDVEATLAAFEADPAVTSYVRPDGEAGQDAPRPARVATALEDLQRLAPQATAQQSAAWQQANVIDLDDDEARQRALDDLEVVSGESRAYRRSQVAVEVLDRAVAATQPATQPDDQPDDQPDAEPEPEPDAQD